jgi:hypothetical protein
VPFSLYRRGSGAGMGAARGRLPAAAGALWFGEGGGGRRPVGSVAGAFTKRKHIPRNTPRVQAGQAGQRREAAAQEGVGRCSEEGRGRPAGPGGVGLGRPSGQGLGRGKGSGLAGVEGVAGQGWAESGAGPEFKMKFFSNFN